MAHILHRPQPTQKARITPSPRRRRRSSPMRSPLAADTQSPSRSIMRAIVRIWRPYIG